MTFELTLARLDGTDASMHAHVVSRWRKALERRTRQVVIYTGMGVRLHAGKGFSALRALKMARNAARDIGVKASRVQLEIVTEPF